MEGQAWLALIIGALPGYLAFCRLLFQCCRNERIRLSVEMVCEPGIKLANDSELCSSMEVIDMGRMRLGASVRTSAGTVIPARRLMSLMLTNI